MYVEYSSDQKVADFVDTTSYRQAARGGTFRPAWLIRTCDWKKVSGNEAQSGYCALSYCWEQSGDLVSKTTGDMATTKTNDSNNSNGRKVCNNPLDYIDIGAHKLIQTSKKEQRQQRSRCLGTFPTSGNNKVKTTIKHVSFEQLLQQICIDFQIGYLWYDKICIDSNDDDKTRLELFKNIHRIYAHANYTVALVPEIKVHRSKDFIHRGSKNNEWCTKARSKALKDLRRSLWFKRIWNLAEVMLSQSILVVGHDINFWQQSQQLINGTTNIIPADMLYGFLLDFPARLRRLQHQNSATTNSGANQVFHQAYFRSSTSQHDTLFALLNIFYPVIPGVQSMLSNVNYTTKNLQHAFQNLYRSIAGVDLSILFFGTHNPTIYGPIQGCGNTMRDYYKLPSWTGISGWHLAGNVVTTTLSEVSNFVDDNMYLHIPANKAHRIYPIPYKHNGNSRKFEGLFFKSQRDIIQEYSKCLNKMNNQKDPVKFVVDDFLIKKYHFELLVRFGCVTTHYLKDTQKNHHFAPGVLSLTDDISDSDECFVLSVFLDNQSCLTEFVNTGLIYSLFPVVEIAIDIGPHACFHPVIKKNITTGKYKAIGIYYIGQLNEEQVSDSRKFLGNLFEKDKTETFIVE